MKELLEAIWRDKHCRCPLNITRWTLGPPGYLESDGLYYSRGKRNSFKQRSTGNVVKRKDCRSSGAN